MVRFQEIFLNISSFKNQPNFDGFYLMEILRICSSKFI